MCECVITCMAEGDGNYGFVLTHMHSLAGPREAFNIIISMQQSHLSDWLGSQLRVLGKLPHPAIALLVSTMVASVTEIMSNIATTTLFLPVLRDLVNCSNDTPPVHKHTNAHSDNNTYTHTHTYTHAYRPTLTQTQSNP